MGTEWTMFNSRMFSSRFNCVWKRDKSCCIKWIFIKWKKGEKCEREERKKTTVMNIMHLFHAFIDHIYVCVFWGFNNMLHILLLCYTHFLLIVSPNVLFFFLFPTLSHSLSFFLFIPLQRCNFSAVTFILFLFICYCFLNFQCMERILFKK